MPIFDSVNGYSTTRGRSSMAKCKHERLEIGADGLERKGRAETIFILFFVTF